MLIKFLKQNDFYIIFINKKKLHERFIGVFDTPMCIYCTTKIKNAIQEKWITCGLDAKF